ncbi:MAG: sodium-dependent transporter, partial [Gemmatimonadales bacterium]
MKHRESGIADRESDLVRQPPSVGRPIVRAQFGSHFGVVMTFIGVAVGLGNVWRFPYMVSAFGGGAFIVVYIVILLAFGIPAIMAEFTLGRLTRRGPVGAFKSSGIPGGRGIGWILFLTVFMAVSYYSVIVGWVLKYLLISLTGSIADMHPSTFFDDLLGGFVGQLILTGAVLGLVAAVLAMGVRAGIERVSKIGMPLLFVLLVVLLVRAVTLPGAIEGLRFYLVPDFTKISPAVVAAALGQVFFSLSLGGTFLLTYSSYLPDSVDIPRSAVIMGIGETAAALLAGLVIVPAAVAFGVELTSGPPLTF